MSGKQFLLFLLFHEIINFVGLKYVYSRYFQRNNYIIKIERIPYGFIGRFKAIRIEKFKLVLEQIADPCNTDKGYGRCSSVSSGNHRTMSPSS